MAFLYVENFESGLDTRKLAFTAPPGTLRELRNAHISRGREIEKRKAFVNIADLPQNTFGLHAVQNQIFVFGSAPGVSVPPTLRYQRLAGPGVAEMVRLHTAENFQGKVYAVAEYSNGTVHHFYNGEIVEDWETISGDIGSTDSIAGALEIRMGENAVARVENSGETITLTSLAPGEAFTVDVISGDISVDTRQAAVPEAGEVRATASFRITGGSVGPTFNTVTAVSLDGVNLLSTPVDYDGANASTASTVADRINSGVSGYQAQSTGNRVVITAEPGLGTDANGRQLDVATRGDVTIGATQDMAGGEDPTMPIPQITDVTVESYSANTLYRVEVNGEPFQITGSSSAMPLDVRTIQQKMYAVTGPFMYFTGFRRTDTVPLPDPTAWINIDGDDPEDPLVFGAGFIDMSTQYSGSEDLAGIGVYQNKAVAFSRRAVHIWTIDPDPAQNRLDQTLLSVGALAHRSIAEYGDLDIFFLSDSGVRSLRARDSSNLASASDVGNPIDAELTEYMRTIPPGHVRNATAVVEPIDSRYLLAIGERVYVFSNFPGSKVSAWSTYELGGRVTDWAVTPQNLFARVGNQVLLYGGFTGQEYDDSEAVVVTPFMDVGNPAQRVRSLGIDMGIVGTWQVEVASEPNAPEYDRWEVSSLLTETSYGTQPNIGMVARSTHLSLRMSTQGRSQRALIGNIVIEFEDID